MFSEIKRYGAAILDLCMPRCCVVCGRNLLLDERHLCTSCMADLPFTRFWLNRDNAMAEKLNALISSDPDSGYEPYSYAAALLYYADEDGYSHIPQSLKYGGDLSQGRFFADMLARRLRASEFFADVDLVVPVPLHWTRRWKRGYNQAEVIAGRIASGLDVRMDPSLLKRGRRTLTQTKMTVQQKSVNVRGAFSLAHPVPQGARHILLVDDVFTTGSTLYECSKAIRQAVGSGVRISVATLSFTSSL